MGTETKRRITKIDKWFAHLTPNILINKKHLPRGAKKGDTILEQVISSGSGVTVGYILESHGFKKTNSKRKLYSKPRR